MRAGTLNKRATFQTLVRVPDNSGGFSKTWTNYIAVWAAFTPDRAKSKIQQGRIADNQAGVLQIRSSAQSRAIDDTYRVILNGVTYTVQAHENPDQTNDVIELLLVTTGETPSTATP